MHPDDIRRILEDVKKGSLDTESAYNQLRDLPMADLGYAMIDNHRAMRTGYPEVIFCSGKSVEHVNGIIEHMITKNSNILATRVTKEMSDSVKQICPDAEYNALARTITIRREPVKLTETFIAIITAGTSDIPVAEEASVTAEIFGNKVERIYDVGVAGIHRIFNKFDKIRQARVLIVIAGMEGALPSVIGGLVDKPVIAVPTSIGYGASFNGLAALLGMLTSCASGLSVVNIDNGFGAGYLASMINKL